MSDKIIVFDTTLRDGEQSPGATMNSQEKLHLAIQLESMGVNIIEAGFPASSSGDLESVREIARTLKKAGVAGLCRTVKRDIDRAWEALHEAANPRLHIFLATSPLHMEYKLRKTPAEVLEMIKTAVSYAASLCPDVEFSAEDASRSEPDFLCQVVETAIRAGAKTINLPDTVGYAQPAEFAGLIREVIERVPISDKAVFSVHCHDDLGLAVANTLAAVRAGVRQVEVTLAGIGERAGNAALEEVVMALKVRKDFWDLETSIDSSQLYPTCRLLSRIIGLPMAANKAIVGDNAFAHESGIHQDGMLKHPGTYEIITPESVGRTNSDIVIGKHSGRNAVRSRLESLGYNLTDERVDLVFEAVKELADRKERIYDEDLEATVLDLVYNLPDKYHLVSLNVQCGTRGSGGVPPTAAAVLTIDGREVKYAAFGDGPVHAVFQVISHLVGRSPSLKRYSVNAITGGADALGEVMVLIEDKGCTAVGRSSDSDVIMASAKAYLNALNRLVKKEKDEECNG